MKAKAEKEIHRIRNKEKEKNRNMAKIKNAIKQNNTNTGATCIHTSDDNTGPSLCKSNNKSEAAAERPTIGGSKSSNRS